MSKREPLSNLVLNFSGRSPSGIACSFMQIDEQWGIKVYSNKDKRDECFDEQKKMAAYGYGPRVGIKFDVGEKYCYISEVATPLVDGNDYTGITYWNQVEQIKTIKRELIQKMESVGFYMCDRHCGNFGILRKRLVCIDFGND